MAKTKKYTTQKLANHYKISKTGQLCQNTDSTMILRFKDTHSVKGIVKTLLALALASGFFHSTPQHQYWCYCGEGILKKFLHVFGLTDT